MKKTPTTDLAARLAELTLDIQSGRISEDDHQAMAEPILAEIQRRQLKAAAC